MAAPPNPPPFGRFESFKTSCLGEITTDDLHKIRPAADALRARQTTHDMTVERDSYEEARKSAGDRTSAARQPHPAPAQPTIPDLHREGTLLDQAQRPISSLQDTASATLNRTPVATPSWHAFDAFGTDASADTQIAVSSTHVVVTTRLTVGFFDKLGKRLREPFYIGDLMTAGVMKALGVTSIFDSRSIFDPFRKRFWVATLANNGKPSTDPSGVNLVLMAVSKTENPMDGWFIHFWPSGANVTDGQDYLALGVSSKCFIQTNYAFGASGGYNNVCFGNADAMAAGLNGDGWRITNLVNPATGATPDFVQPVSHHGSTSFLYLVGRDGNSIVTWKVENPLAPNQAVTSTSYPVSAFGIPQAAPQPNNVKPLWFGQLGNMILKAVYRSGKLYVVANDAKNWFGDAEVMTSIRVIRINTIPINTTPGSGNPVEIDRVFGCNSGFDDKPTDRVYYGFPAIEVTAQGHMVIVYSRSGTTVNPEARISAWPAPVLSHPTGGDILPSRLLKAGEKPYKLSWAASWGVYPWADLAGASVDPSTNRHVWVATCYATSTADNNWGVWVGRVGLETGSTYSGSGIAAVGQDLI